MQSLEQIAMKKLYIDLTLISDFPAYRQKQIIKDYLLSENNKKTYSWIIKELDRIKTQYPNLDCVSNEILDDLKKIPKYYAYHQKGWGKYYDRNISNYTVIEAYSAIEANEKAKRLGIDIDPNQNSNNEEFPKNELYIEEIPYLRYFPFWNIVSEEDGYFNEIENIDEPDINSYFVHYIDGSMFRSRKATPYLRDMFVIYDDVNYNFMDLPNITINEIE